MKENTRTTQDAVREIIQDFIYSECNIGIVYIGSIIDGQSNITDKEFKNLMTRFRKEASNTPVNLPEITVKQNSNRRFVALLASATEEMCPFGTCSYELKMGEPATWRKNKTEF